MSHNDVDITYSFNGYGEQTGVAVAGKDYVSVIYLSDTATLSEYASGEKIQTTKDKQGNVLKSDYIKNGSTTTILANTYDSDNNLTAQVEDIYSEKHKYSYSYDKFGNQTYFAKEKMGTSGNLPTLEKEIEISNQFNKFGNLTKSQVTIDDAIMKTTYTYDDSIDNKLKSVNLSNDLTQTIEYDNLNRTKDIYTGDKLSKHINFVKRGEYASNLIASEWFGENIAYTYNASVLHNKLNSQ